MAYLLEYIRCVFGASIPNVQKGIAESFQILKRQIHTTIINVIQNITFEILDNYNKYKITSDLIKILEHRIIEN